MRLSYSFYITKRKKTGIVIDGYTFYKLSEREDTYRCTFKGCCVRVILIDELKADIRGIHSDHKRNAESILKRKEINEQVRKLAKKSFLKPNEIISSLRCKYNTTDNINIVQNDKYLKEIVRNERKYEIGAVTDTTGIILDYYTTLEKEKFIQHLSMEENEKKILILYNEENKIHLKNSNTWVCDGTFFSCPKGFRQMYVLHCKIFHNLFPIAYIFLNGKSYISYLNAFSIVKESLNGCNPHNIIIDFEMAAFKALKEVFSNSNIFFCNFHFGQSFYKKILKLGLFSLYNKSSLCSRYLKMILALPYEKPEKVKEQFIKIKNKLIGIYNNEQLKLFLNYFDKTYVGISSNPVFSVINWSTHSRILENIPTTTNFAEAWNKDINYSIGHANPTLNEIIKEIRTKDYLYSIEIKKFLVGGIYTEKLTKSKFKEILENYDKYYDLTFLFVVSEIKEENYMKNK